MSTFKNEKIIMGDKEYKICEPIGSGGNSCVWSTRNLEDGQEFAIKFLDIKSDTEKIERFKREIAFCYNNKHKNIIPVYADGVFKDRVCYLMPKYNKTLRVAMSEEKSYLELINYIIQMCEGIKFAHGNKVIHRDIKPENILIDKEGVLIIADFGIAHFENSLLTETKEWLGNKSYAAPEQLIKKTPYTVTAACDIYALGKIINEMFTKQNAAGTQFITISDSHPILYRLDRIVHRCLMQNPNERPTIDEVLMEVRLIEGQLKETLKEIEEYLLLDKVPEYIETFINKLLQTACEENLRCKFCE